MAGSQFRLLKERRFLPYFITQFLGAFNDNVYRNAFIVLVSFQLSSKLTMSPEVFVNVAAGLFILPFFLFSAFAGQMADKFEKGYLIRWLKLSELVIVLCAVYAFIACDVYSLLFILFLLGTQSALYGPVKYSILPQHLSSKELVGGNGLVEMGTFVAILIGTLFGGIVITIPHYGTAAICVSIVMIALIGWVASYFIPYSRPNAPDLKFSWNIPMQIWQSIRFARETRAVFLAIMGISWFWFFGLLILTQIPLYVKINLGGDSHVVPLLLTAFSIGIGMGSLLCEHLSGRRIELGLVPFGSIGMTLFGIDLYFAHSGLPVTPHLLGIKEFLSYWHNIHVLIDCILLGMFSGFYTVTLYSIIQHRSEAKHRSRIIAANNIINALMMVACSAYAGFALGMGLSIPQLFLVTAILNIIVTFYIYSLMPEYLMRFLVWIWISMMYRVQAKNIDQHIPSEGAAVLICNHVSYVDALIMMATIRRPIRFVMDYHIFKIPILSFIFRTNRAIPIAAAKDNPEIKAKAFEMIAKALKDGELVAIFPEGAITKDGELQPFRPGIEEIIRTTPVPVIPLALRGLWGSFFSRKYGKAMSHFPRRFRARIHLIAGNAVPPAQVNKDYLHEIVLQLRGDEL